jgi:hypothetical protein
MLLPQLHTAIFEVASPDAANPVTTSVGRWKLPSLQYMAIVLPHLVLPYRFSAFNLLHKNGPNILTLSVTCGPLREVPYAVGEMCPNLRDLYHCVDRLESFTMMGNRHPGKPSLSLQRIRLRGYEFHPLVKFQNTADVFLKAGAPSLRSIEFMPVSPHQFTKWKEQTQVQLRIWYGKLSVEGIRLVDEDGVSLCNDIIE